MPEEKRKEIEKVKKDLEKMDESSLAVMVANATVLAMRSEVDKKKEEEVKAV